MTLAVALPTESSLEPDQALQVSHLDVAYRVRGHDRLTLRDVSFEIGRQESFGLVGESGCGKSTTALAVTSYLARNGRVSGGSIAINGRDLSTLGREELRQLRARTVSMVYQEPGRALNPSIKVGRQVAEVFEIAGVNKREALERAEESLRTVQISDPGRVLRAFPHQLSGGMLAARRHRHGARGGAVPARPRRADDSARRHRRGGGARPRGDIGEQFRTSLLFISHNLAVIAKMCDRLSG